MFTKSKKFTLEEGQVEFDQKGYQVGIIDFQILELQTSKNRILNEMQHLEKQGKEAREKLKKKEILKAAEAGPEEDAIN